jgi:hypothetical protein
MACIAQLVEQLVDTSSSPISVVRLRYSAPFYETLLFVSVGGMPINSQM